MTSFLMPFFLFISVALCAKENIKFSCEKCESIYWYCIGKEYHLSNDYYYFSTDPDCEMDAFKTLGKIEAYRDIFDILRSSDKPAREIRNSGG